MLRPSLFGTIVICGVMSSAVWGIPSMWYTGDVQLICGGPPDGPWTYQVDWHAQTAVTGVPAASIDEIGVQIDWEVPLGEQDPAGSGYYSNGASKATSVIILSGEIGPSDHSLP
jgi:hypothetical protein